MTVVREASSPCSVRLVECPFCEANLRDKRPPAHLETCVEFYRQNGVEVPTWWRVGRVADLENAEEAADG